MTKLTKTIEEVDTLLWLSMTKRNALSLIHKDIRLEVSRTISLPVSDRIKMAGLTHELKVKIRLD